MPKPFAQLAIEFFRNTPQTNWGKNQIVAKLTDFLLESMASDEPQEEEEHANVFDDDVPF